MKKYRDVQMDELLIESQDESKKESSDVTIDEFMEESSDESMDEFIEESSDNSKEESSDRPSSYSVKEAISESWNKSSLEINVNDASIRDRILMRARKQYADYVMFLDSNVLLTNIQVLWDLLTLDHVVMGPLLTSLSMKIT